MKKVLSALLALCLLMGTAPMLANAAGNLTVSIADGGYDPGRLVIHNVQSQQTASLYGLDIPLYNVAPGELFTKYFDYTDAVKNHNCGDCGYVVSLCEANLMNGELRSTVNSQYPAEPVLEADVLVWNSPETAASWGPGQVTGDHYTFSSTSVGKVYCVLIQYEDDSNGHLGDTTHFALHVTKPTVGGFGDVYEGDYYADPVVWAVENNITSGTNSAGTTFSPSQPCTRAQIATFLWRFQGETAASKPAAFADMTTNATYNAAISWAVEAGIAAGTSAVAFSPNAGCTRAQAVTFLWRAAGRPEPASTAAFADMPATPEFQKAISWASENGITSGTSATAFSPNKTCSRGEIVTFLYRAKDLMGN